MDARYYWQKEEFWLKSQVSPRQKIEWFQARVLAHSLLYERYQTRIISEKELLALSYALASLQVDHMDDAINSLYFFCFYDWMLGDWQIKEVCKRLETDEHAAIRIKNRLISELRLAITLCSDSTQDDEWGIRLVQNSRLTEGGTYIYERQNLTRWKEIVAHNDAE